MHWWERIKKAVSDFVEDISSPAEWVSPLATSVEEMSRNIPSTATVAPQTTPSPTPTPTIPPVLKDYLGETLARKFLSEQLPIIERVAEEESAPVDILLAQYLQESSLGTNPAVFRENEATALGPFQIKRNWATPQYPAFPDLYIEPEDRLDLEKSARFAARHYRRLTDYYGNPKTALGAYGPNRSYADVILKHTKSPLITQILEYISESEKRR